MIEFDKPTQLNGNQLRKELISVGVTIKDEFSSILIDGNDKMWLDIAAKDESKAKTVVNAHIGIDESLAKAEQKSALLAKLGITAEEAKLLLS